MATSDVTIRPFPDEPTAAARPRRAPGSVVGAVGAGLGPLLLGAGLALWPWDLAADDGAPDATAVADSADRAILAMNLTSLGCVLSIGAVLATAALASRRLPRTVTWGAVLAVAGLCSMLLYSAADIAYVATRDVAPGASLDAWGRAYSEDMYTIALFSLCPLAVVGLVLLAVALWRSAAVPGWAAACVGLGSGVLVAAIMEIGVLALPFMVLAAIGAVPVARALLAGRVAPDS